MRAHELLYQRGGGGFEGADVAYAGGLECEVVSAEGRPDGGQCVLAFSDWIRSYVSGVYSVNARCDQCPVKVVLILSFVFCAMACVYMRGKVRDARKCQGQVLLYDIGAMMQEEPRIV